VSVGVPPAEAESLDSVGAAQKRWAQTMGKKSGELRATSSDSSP
jgi:hypothetical protein